MQDHQCGILETILGLLDHDLELLLQGVLDDVPGIRDIRQIVNEARNAINGVLNRVE
jgi:hypothetical protein